MIQKLIFILVLNLILGLITVSAQTFDLQLDFDDGGDSGWGIVSYDSESLVLISFGLCQPENVQCSRFIRTDFNGVVLDTTVLLFGEDELFQLPHFGGLEKINGRPSYTGAFKDENGWEIVFHQLDEDFDFKTMGYPTSEKDAGRDLIDLGDGTIMICGENYSFSGDDHPEKDHPFLAKVDYSGDLIWLKVFEELESSFFYDMELDLNGDLIISGRRRVFYDEPLYQDARGFLLKCDTSGVQEWIYDVEGLTYSETGGMFDSPIRFELSPDGGIVYSSNYEVDEWYKTKMNQIRKLDSNLNEVWRYSFDKLYSTSTISLTVLPDNSIIGCGDNLNHPWDGRDHTGWAFKLSADGELLWERQYIPESNIDPLYYLYDFIVLENGDLILTGVLLSEPNTYSDIWLMRTDSNGCLEPGCDEEVIYLGLDDLNVIGAPRPSFFNISKVQLDFLVLEFTYLIESDYEFILISDLNGRTCIKEPLENGMTKFELAIGSLPSGTYLVSYFKKDRVFESKKFVKP